MQHINNLYAMVSIITVVIGGLIAFGLVLKHKRRIKIGPNGQLLDMSSQDEQVEHRVDARLRTLIDEFKVSVESIGTSIDACLKNQLQMELSIMRLQIVNDQMPPKDRLDIYDAYKKKGGNNWIDTYVVMVLRPLVKRSIAEQLVLEEGEKEHD
jgi:hypothetical protein